MGDLHLEVKNMIIEVLDLEDMDASDIIDGEPLFVEGLGLDSIDALEIGLALQKRYQIKISSESDDTRQHFASVNNLVSFIESHRSN